MAKPATKKVAPCITKYSGDQGVTYHVRLRLKGHAPVNATFHRLTDAKQWRDKTKVEVSANRYGVTSTSMKTSFGEMVDTYLSNNSVPKYVAKILSWWKSKLGPRMLSAIGPQDLVALRNEMRRTKKRNGQSRSPATINRYCSYLSSVYTAACDDEWGICTENPMRKLTKLPEAKHRVRFLDDDERDALLEACKESDASHLYSFVVAALSTGARAGELKSLDWKDIDFERGGAVLYDTKNGDTRSIPIKGHCAELLKARRGIGPVFTNNSGSAPFLYDKPYRKAIAKAEISDATFHTLRHCAASYSAQNDASLLELAELLGHRTLACVKIYAHLTDSSNEKLGDYLNERMFGK